MIVKLVAGIIAAVLLAAFLGAVVLKLKDAALAAVALIGLAMMLYELWETLRENDR